jgi:hypothetical protein
MRTAMPIITNTSPNVDDAIRTAHRSNSGDERLMFPRRGQVPSS